MMTYRTATDALSELGVTQDEIAAAFGVGPSMVRAIRSGRRRPRSDWPAVLAELARARAVELPELLAKRAAEEEAAKAPQLWALAEELATLPWSVPKRFGPGAIIPK
jgi:transcriptional regulator with XRE-family HTH domain